MKTSRQLLLLGVLSALPAVAAAAEGDAAPARAAPPDTSQWKCEACKFDEGPSGAVEAGAGSVSDKSAKFGEYNGLQKKGGYLIGDGTARYRSAEGAYWNVNASNLGLATRSVDAEVGQQGKYKFLLKYDELPHIISDSAQTPFAGTGTASLTLPAVFAGPRPAGTLPAPAVVSSTLQQVNLSTQRKRVAAGASWMPVQDWEYALNFRHETRDGTKRTAGAFFFTSAQLVEPVDYSTDQVDASASYTGGRLQARFAYYGSTFRNSNNALTWQNPFSSVVAGDAQGQLGLPPDNQFHQILASAGYQFSSRTRASADVAVGRMTQNEAFLSATLNPNLVQVLPTSALNGRADTFNANLKLTSALTNQLRLNALLAHDERDNRTPQASYPFISTDMFGPTPRTNLPYSFKQDKLKLSGDYRFAERTTGSVGFDHDTTKRTFQEATRSNEQTAWARVRSRLVENVDLTFKLAHGERKISDYQPAGGVTPAENPLLRKYNMADRKRNSVALRADIAAAEYVGIGLGFEASRDAYPNSPVGLTDGRDFNVNGDVSLRVSDQTTVQVFASHQEIRSRQAGSQFVLTPDWTAQNVDTINVLGVGLKHAAIPDKLDIGADYSVSRSLSNITVTTGLNEAPFPDRSAYLNSLKLYATYRLSANVSINAGLWRELYSSQNWMLQGVGPTTIGNLLAFGEQPPRYSINVARLSLRYAF